MMIIWRTIALTLILCFFFIYFFNPPMPNPLLVLYFLGSIISLFIIHRNRSVYEEPFVLYTFEDGMLDGYVIDENKDCCNNGDDDCFRYYGDCHEVVNEGYIRNNDEDYIQSDEDDGAYDIEDGDDDDDDDQDGGDDDILRSKIDDYIASVKNGWREERKAEKLLFL